MSIHRFKSTWRSITFNDRYDDTGVTDDPLLLTTAKIGLDYYLDAVDINRVSVQDYRELRQFLEGAEPNEAFEGVRAINGQGRIVANDQTVLGTDALRRANLEDMAWALNEAFSVAACRLAAAALTPVGVLPYDFKRSSVAGTKSLRAYARPGPGRPIWIGRRAEGFIRAFSFQLISFDPFMYDQAAVVSPNVATGAPVNVTNPGNMYTKATLTLAFSGNSFATVTITNITTGQVLVLDLSTFGANSLVIDVARSTITRLSDGANMYSKRVSGYVSSMFLAPGVNSIRIDNGLNCTGATFSIRGAYA